MLFKIGRACTGKESNHILPPLWHPPARHSSDPSAGLGQALPPLRPGSPAVARRCRPRGAKVGGRITKWIIDSTTCLVWCSADGMRHRPPGCPYCSWHGNAVRVLSGSPGPRFWCVWCEFGEWGAAAFFWRTPWQPSWPGPDVDLSCLPTPTSNPRHPLTALSLQVFQVVVLSCPDGCIRRGVCHQLHTHKFASPAASPGTGCEGLVCAQVPVLPLPLPPQPAASVLAAIAAAFAFAAQFAQIWLLTAAPPTSLREMAAQRRRCVQYRTASERGRKQNM